MDQKSLLNIVYLSYLSCSFLDYFFLNREYLDENCPPGSRSSKPSTASAASDSKPPQSNKSPKSKSNLDKEIKSPSSKSTKKKDAMDDGYESDKRKLNKKPLENRVENEANQASSKKEADGPKTSGAGPVEAGDATSNMVEISIPEGSTGQVTPLVLFYIFCHLRNVIDPKPNKEY